MLGWGFGAPGQLHQGPIPGNSMVGGGQKVMSGNVPNELATDLKACNAYDNGKAAATGIEGPIQVILARKDKMAPYKAGMQLVDHLASPEVHILEGCGHMIPQEAPDECRTLLRDFIFQHNQSI